MHWGRLILLVCAGTGVFICAASFVCCRCIMGYRSYAVPEERVAAEPGAHAFTVPTRSGAELACVYIPAADPRGVIIASHGIADSKDGIYPILRPFLDAGFGLVVYDLRHHNESTGASCTLGCAETGDLCDLTRHVRSAIAPGLPVYYWGFSLGGTISLLAAARGAEVEGVVAQSPFVSVRGVVAHYVNSFYHLPAWPVVPLALTFLEWQTGCDIDTADIRAYAGRFPDIPVLLLASKNDQQVPAAWIPQIAESIGTTARARYGPYGHAEQIGEGEADVWSRVAAEFFRECGELTGGGQ